MRRSKAAIRTVALLILTVSGVLAWSVAAQATIIERVNVALGGGWGDAGSYSPSVDADGSHIAYKSGATNLVAGDTNAVEDIFIFDRDTGVTTRVSVATDGTQGNGMSSQPAVDSDGDCVAFVSNASNLVTGDTNGVQDVFVRDLFTGTTERVSVATGGTEANSYSEHASISADGNYVVFESFASNLVSGDTNGVMDVFVYNRATDTTELVSVATDGTQGNNTSFAPAISGDGLSVAFSSYATNLVAGDTNAKVDVFLRNRVGSITTRVSVDSSGNQGSDHSGGASISADGSWVAFESWAPDLVAGDTNASEDVFVCDTVWGITYLVSFSTGGALGAGSSWAPSISSDGRFVAFASAAANLVVGDTNSVDDILVRDRQAGTVKRVNVAADETQADMASESPSISGDGRYVAFDSIAGNLITGDPNGAPDIFLVTNAIPPTYSSIRGSDRYDTAVKISQAMYPTALPAGSGLVVAPGETFPEALCGAPLASAYGGPVLLTYKAALANNVKAELTRLAPTYVFCIGLSAAAVNSVRTALPTATVQAINGSGTAANLVYDMSRKVANALKAKLGDLSGATAIVTIGTNFPDAIGVSPLACCCLWPIILTNNGGGGALHPSATATFTDLGITHALKVGTYATLPAGVTGVGNCSGADRYYTNAYVALWSQANPGLLFEHTGLATGDKFPDALASGPYLALNKGILLLSPLYGPLPDCIAQVIALNASDIEHVTFIACIEPVIGQVKGLLP